MVISMLCLNCNSLIKSKNKYCSNKCQLEYQYKTETYKGANVNNGIKSRSKYYINNKKGESKDE